MGCACKVSQKVDYIHKKYGDDVPTKKTKPFNIDVRKIIIGTPIILVEIIFIPFMFAHLLYKGAKKEIIRIV